MKIASMIDEHTRESLLHLVERSITADRLVTELGKVFDAADGPPMVLRMDNESGFISVSLEQLCAGRGGLPASRRARHGTTVTSNPSTAGCWWNASTATIGRVCSKHGW
ncbi:integrase catalytic domain-containing protein [Nocardia salmonicida]|uniref:integrase catalytic domain-containing protein n=1 Tax=Nocardia salmonicida TaxID=53431 RepID=UPI003CF58C49